jgi:7-cyano-7-deazaguanine synthase
MDATNAAVVLLSGGQDSTTCLYLAMERWGKEQVVPLSIFYGQKHYCEIGAARTIVERAGLLDRYEVIHLPDGVLHSTSPLVDHQTKVAQYDSSEVLPGGLEATFVPLRNLLFLTLAANRARHLAARYVVTGVSQEDFGGYPDCRDQFLLATEHAIHEALDDPTIRIWAPLLHLSKAASVLAARKVAGCWDALAYSHTCYNGVYPPCGHCHACLLRERGFQQAGFVDPLLERASREGAHDHANHCS